MHTYLYVVRFPLTNLLVVHVRLLSEFVPAIARSRCGLRFLCAVTAFLYQCCVQSCFPTPLIADIPTTVPLNLCFRYSRRAHLAAAATSDRVQSHSR